MASRLGVGWGNGWVCCDHIPLFKGPWASWRLYKGPHSGQPAGSWSNLILIMWQKHEESFKGLSEGKMAPVCQESLDGHTETHGLNTGFWCLKKLSHIITRLHTIEREEGCARHPLFDQIKTEANRRQPAAGQPFWVVLGVWTIF